MCAIRKVAVALAKQGEATNSEQRPTRSALEALRLPVVSIVIPARNEAAHIGDLLRSIAASDYPADRIEVIVVDGMSADATATIARSFVTLLPNLRVVENPSQITPVAFNLGIKAASGRYITILSGHSTIDSSYLRDTLEAFARHPADVVGGRLINVGQGPFGRIMAAMLESSLVVGNARFRYSNEEGPVDTVLGTYRREVFDRVGLFDERLRRNQDNEFNSRIRAAGGTIYLVPKLAVRYRVRRHLRGAVKQFFGNGRWTVYVARLNRTAMGWRHFVPALFVAAVIAATVTSVLLHTVIPLAVVLAPYTLVVAATMATVRLAVVERLAVIVVQPLLHVSYGMGSLIGLVTRLPRG
jgi:glycosyltransferase involved in cell wall biosynthesis